MALRPTPATLRVLLLIAVCGVAGLLGMDALAHAQRHAAWASMRARLGAPTYDAARSDSLYDAVFTAREALRRDASLLGVLLIALGASAPPTQRDPRGSPSALRRLAATIADGATLSTLAVLLGLAARTADLDGSEAVAAVLGRLVWLVPPATLALALRRGIAPSSRLAPPESAPTSMRALAGALLTLPAAAFALLVSPVVAPLAARRPRLTGWLVAPHEALFERP